MSTTKELMITVPGDLGDFNVDDEVTLTVTGKVKRVTKRQEYDWETETYVGPQLTDMNIEVTGAVKVTKPGEIASDGN